MAATDTASLAKRTRQLTQKDIIEKFCKGPYKLNLGSGRELKEGYINIDCGDYADLQVDLEVAHLPFPKGSVTHILASHVFEHLNNFPKLMNELHRVMSHKGKLDMRVPCYPAAECFHDPSHVRVFTNRTMEYFHKGTFLHENCGATYGYLGWSKMIQKLNRGWELFVTLDK